MAIPLIIAHRDFVDQGYNPLAGPLGGGDDKYGVKNSFYWDPDLLDGAPVYTFEFTVDNPSVAAGRVALCRLNSWPAGPGFFPSSVTELTGSSISIPGGTPATTYRVGPVTIPSGNFFLPSGSLLLPIVENPAVVTGAGMTLTMGRLKYTQTNATKTLLWRPLVNGFEGTGDCYYCQSDLLLSLNTPEFPLNAGLWNRLDSDFIASSASYRVYSVIGGTHTVAIFGPGIRVGIYNYTSGVVVTNSEIAMQPPQAFFQSPQFSWPFTAGISDPQFVNNNNFQWGWIMYHSGDVAKLFGAGLYIVLSGIEKVTTWARVAKGSGTSTNGVPGEFSTARVLGADFAGAQSCFLETSGYMENATVTGRTELRNAGASDTATTGSALAGTEAVLSTISPGRQVIRSASFSPSLFPAGSRIISMSSLQTGSGADLHNDWVLIGGVWGAASSPVCIVVSASIDTTTMTVSGTATGQNATRWEVIRVSDGVVMDSGTGNDAVFSFIGEFGVTYEVVFYA